jgi:putative protease
MTKANNNLRKIELLAPARDAATAMAAIEHGADAVYIGADSFGARSAAGNSVSDISKVVEYAHQFGARVYVTVNTIIYNNELNAVEQLIRELYRIGVDALIVQDMAVLRMDIPPIALHASTQCDTRTPERAKFLEDVGFSQIVLPREFTLDEIRQVSEQVDVPLEAFVHGALCVSYSGDCHAGYVLKGRSANRGECPQICRLSFDLYDGTGKCVERGRHFLSLRDMNRSHNLLAMMEAGVSSFKIEGRLKDAGYVKNVTAFYRKAIDDIIARYPDRYARSSAGEVKVGFTPNLSRSFNRGFTSYFITGPSPKMASIYTPKSQGERVGEIVAINGGVIKARLNVALANGDGLGFFNKDNRFEGFRLNKVVGDKLYPATPVKAASGTVLYRNSDKAFDDLLARDTTQRLLPIDLRLRRTPWGLALDISDSAGHEATVTAEVDEFQPARTPQLDARRRALQKLGGTIYELRDYSDEVGDYFVPVSELASLRRKAIEWLESTLRATYIYDTRRRELPDVQFPGDRQLTYHENVSNELARDFYRSHGVGNIEPAIEADGGDVRKNLTVMTTRYCLRRELGACLKERGAAKLPEPLTLVSGPMRLKLKFDCKRCGMDVIAIADNNNIN